MYAIVDIETTGGSAAGSSITEVAIVLHNGKDVTGKYHTLINPVRIIPKYITALTGISTDTVKDAPLFENVAENIYNLLHDKIFVAHNVNFDYSFLKHHLALNGFELNTKKLCTVRSARKVFPGFASYSLGNLCRELGIIINNRHRAQGDVDATVKLFEKVLENDTALHVAKMIKGRNSEQYLPPHLSSKQIELLPQQPGVYYFHDGKGKIIYVGKATNLKRRVKSHFSNNDSSKRKQELMRHVYSISHVVCTSELMALIKESIEIRTLWPLFNRSQKKYHHTYGLYTYEDQRGYQHLVIDKKKPQLTPHYTFNLLHEGQVLLKKLVSEFDIDENFLQLKNIEYDKLRDLPDVHNKRIQQALTHLQNSLPTFAVLDGDDENAKCLLIEKGKFFGLGNLSFKKEKMTLEEIKAQIEQQPDNDYIRGLIHQYVTRFPKRKIAIISE